MKARPLEYGQTDRPLVNVTNGRDAHSKHWIAVLVQSHREKKVAILLQKAGYETYIPVQTEVHQWSDRKKKVDRILIPMVVFVRATETEEMWLREQSFVYKLIALPGSEESRRNLASPIPDEQINALKFLSDNADSEITIIDKFCIGDIVKVSSGPLRGLEGVVCEADENSIVVGIRIEGLGYACVKISKNYLTCSKEQ